MRPLFIILPVIVLLVGCATFTQIVYVSPSNTKAVRTEESYYVYENDTIQVVYYFWDSKGAMSFMIQNKLNIPIYIDWKKSSFIDRSEKLDYYFDKTVSNSASVGTAAQYLYKNPLNWSSFYQPFILSAAVSSSTVVKEERITFIPPKARIVKGMYKIIPSTSHFNVSGAVRKEITLSNGNKIPVLVQNTERDSSAVIFRNFITYSTKESFDSESYIDNEFFVSKVLTVNQLYTEGDYTYEDPRRFYLLSVPVRVK